MENIFRKLRKHLLITSPFMHPTLKLLLHDAKFQRPRNRITIPSAFEIFHRTKSTSMWAPKEIVLHFWPVQLGLIMRLTESEKSIIVNSIQTIDPDAEVYLFGSRTDDTKTGGDIDLLVFSQTLDRELKRKIKFNLYDKLGEQKIDILIAKDTSDPFVWLAKSEGISL